MLQSLSEGHDDIGRWARRGCFLLLNVVGPDEKQWFLENSGVKDPKHAEDFVKELATERDVSERLTKALIAEKVAMGEWTDRELDMLALMMFRLAKKFSKTKKIENYAAIQQVAADILRVKRGDLRRGPFSPILLRRAWEKEWEDLALSNIFSFRWKKILTSSASAEYEFKAPELAPLSRLLNDQFES